MYNIAGEREAVFVKGPSVKPASFAGKNKPVVRLIFIVG